jgi:hypothetical protein
VPEQLGEISARIFETERGNAAEAMSQACDEIQQVMRALLLELLNHLRERSLSTKAATPLTSREAR